MNQTKFYQFSKVLFAMLFVCSLFVMYPGTSSAMLLLQINKTATEMILGDCQIKDYEGWIAAMNFSWDVNREFKESAKAGTSDIFTGISTLGPLVITKSLDKSSPYLNFGGSGGGQIGESLKLVLLTNSGSTAEPVKMMVYTLDKPIVASVSISGDEDGRPVETVSFIYNKIMWEYYIYKADGTLDKIIKMGWDRVANKSWNGQ